VTEVIDKLKGLTISIMIWKEYRSVGINHTDDCEPRIFHDGLDITDEQLKEAVEKIKEVISGN